MIRTLKGNSVFNAMLSTNVVPEEWRRDRESSLSHMYCQFVSIYCHLCELTKSIDN